MWFVGISQHGNASKPRTRYDKLLEWKERKDTERERQQEEQCLPIFIRINMIRERS